MTQQDWKVQTTRLIIDAINELPQGERDAFVCKHYKGMNVEAIAAHLHSTVDETRETLKKAEHRLNKKLNRMNYAFHRASWAFC